MDIALILQDDKLHADIDVRAGAPVIDDGLSTAVYISLFSDAAVEGLGGGWWGDMLETALPAESGKLGSRLWTLVRAKLLPGIEKTIAGYCNEALRWMIDSGIASSISVDVSVISGHNILIDVRIFQPGNDESRDYRFNWDAQAAASMSAVIEELDAPKISAVDFDGAYSYDGYVTHGRIS